MTSNLIALSATHLRKGIYTASYLTSVGVNSDVSGSAYGGRSLTSEIQMAPPVWFPLLEKVLNLAAASMSRANGPEMLDKTAQGDLPSCISRRKPQVLEYQAAVAEG
jgi:hypothetical protein